MGTVAHAEQRLIRGSKMICPRCTVPHDILAYVPLMQIERYESETNPIYKCPDCRWLFSPASDITERP